MRNTWLSLLIMTLSIYAVRMLPFLLLRKNITNRFIRSFLFYVPYVTLAVMTFPAILSATANPGAIDAGRRNRTAGNSDRAPGNIIASADSCAAAAASRVIDGGDGAAIDNNRARVRFIIISFSRSYGCASRRICSPDCSAIDRNRIRRSVITSSNCRAGISADIHFSPVNCDITA